MILGTIRRILKEDLAKFADIPAWIDPLLTPLNQFIDTTTLALRNNLTFKDNFACKVVTQKFSHNVELQVSVQARSKVIGMIPISTGAELLDGYGFSIKGNGSVGITLRFVSLAQNVDSTVVLLLN